MRQFLSRWGSTLIYWSFAVTGVTGVLLFFHVRMSPVEELHIWIGFLMIAAFVPHIARNWRSFLGYFHKAPLYVALAVTIAISALFAYPALSGSDERAGGPPDMRAAFAITAAMSTASLEAIAPILRTDTDELIDRLEAAGAKVSDGAETLQSIAETSGQSVSVLLATLFSTEQGGDAPATPLR